MFDKEKRIQTAWFVGVCSCPIVINLLFVYIFVVLAIENNSKK